MRTLLNTAEYSARTPIGLPDPGDEETAFFQRSVNHLSVDMM